MIRSNHKTNGNPPATVQEHWYECPQCQAKDNLELVEIDVIMSSKIVIRRSADNAIEAELGEASGFYESNPDRIQCGNCGHLLRNEYDQKLNSLAELELFLERGGAS